MTRCAAAANARLGIAVAERAVAREVRADAPRAAPALPACDGIARIDDDRQRSVVDLDQVERILGAIAVGRDDDGDRLADIAHALDRDGARLHGRPIAGEERPGDAGDVGSDNNRDNAGSARCSLTSIDTMSACACGERRTAACRACRPTPRSSM